MMLEHFVVRPYWYFTFPLSEVSSGCTSSTFCHSDAGRFRKILKIKITGKTTGDSLLGRENTGLRHFQQTQEKYYCHCFVYSSLIIIYSLLFMDYSLLVIICSLLVIFYSLLIIVYSFLIIVYSVLQIQSSS